MSALTDKLSSVAKKMGTTYTFKSRSLSLDEVFSATGLLPGLSKRADQLASLCLGYNLGATYEDDENAVLGNTVSYDEFTPDVLRLFCIIDVLHEIAKSSGTPGVVALDELMYD